MRDIFIGSKKTIAQFPTMSTDFSKLGYYEHTLAENSFLWKYKIDAFSLNWLNFQDLTSVHRMLPEFFPWMLLF